ncbi:DUF3311 domain-containing protein [Nocardioides panacihumi]|uniref:DUF3311 domain-containing protein n=1 Tax=Nocardioides panacihumi TaxID=400774 RepID=UPI0031D23985
MPARSSRALWIVVGILLLPPIVVPLLVGLYAKEDPTLWGFPFYYWFQFLLIPCAAAFTVTAYYLAKEAVRRDRAAKGLPDLDARGERR